MKERPILFSAPMVRAILDGTKTQTRRVVKLPKDLAGGDLSRAWHDLLFSVTHGLKVPMPDETVQRLRNPWGWPEPSRLWVRETCQAWSFDVSGESVIRYTANGAFRQIENTQDAADKWCELYAYSGKKGAKVPSIFMPRWASRITLEITGVRVERLHDISDEDAIAEGAGGDATITPRYSVERYHAIWESINGTGSWDTNPWVWVIEFKRVLP